MSQTLKRAAAVTGTVLGLGALATGCLTRPVVSNAPTLKTNFTDSLDNTGVDKVDILFMIDNSASMGDKQVLLADAVPDMLNRLVTPNCVNAGGTVVGTTDATGACPNGGSPEFSAVHDMHIGIVSSSLGGRGGAGAGTTKYANGDQCNPGGDGQQASGSPNTTAVHMNDKGELLNRAGEDEHTIANASPDNYLAWFPAITANKGGSTAPQPAVVTAGVTNTYTTADVPLNPAPDDTSLIGAFQDMIVGVHEQGCGYEAQLESWYRFLIEPNPYQSIAYDTSKGVPIASYVGVDNVIIQQRAAFLRPDSLVAVIVVTDENQEVADPLQLSGTAWAFENADFPGSPGWPTYGATEGTTKCATNPTDPACQCCATISDPAALAANCQNQNDSGTGSAIYYTPAALDEPNVRFFHMKQRFGVDVGYPSSRYVNGLTNSVVPKQSYDQNPDHSLVACTNPLFASTLPTDSTKELCNLPANGATGRHPGGNLVYYAAITGVPHQLIQSTPGDGECPTGTAAADCPQKSALTAADWITILGNDPENYDFTGVDFHMLESWIPRDKNVQAATGAINASNCLPGSPDNCDPINGREYNTADGQLGYSDLEYACTFLFNTPKDCTQPQYNGACDCQHDPDSGAPLVPNGTSSLCQQTGGTYGTTQTYGKAYPCIEELSVARQLKDYGIVSSLCPIHPTPVGGPNDQLYGYRPAVNAIINRLKAALQVACPPHKLQANAQGIVSDCLVLATWKSTTGMPASCSAAGDGYSDADPNVLAQVKADQHSAWVAAGGNATNTPDPNNLLTCAMGPLSPAMNGGASCQAPNANTQGWCYYENTNGAASDAGPACSYQILFANSGPDKAVTVSLTCVEQAGSDGG